MLNKPGVVNPNTQDTNAKYAIKCARNSEKNEEICRYSFF